MLRRSNNRLPDVLDCLANLSNDEVFTPPSVVNQMLDMLPQEVFESKDTTFLDPFTKSGVFLREITKRLLDHQVPAYKETANEIERVTKEAIQDAVRSGKLDLMDKDYEDKARAIGDAAIKNHPEAVKFIVFEKQLQDALDHILRKQVFGIAITELTANLARRSLYCSKDAAGKYSVSGTAFAANSDGNVRFVPMKHTWRHELKFNSRYQQDKDGTWHGAWQGWDDKNKKFVPTSCMWCGTAPEQLERADDYESHAYEFIHTDKPEEIWNMEFTVICGNPPYQLSDGGAQASAIPIYNKFIEQAKRLNPRYLTMIVPSRWMTGGKGLDKFRDVMIHDDSIRELHDFADSKMCFQGVDIKGGVCYFLRDREYHGDCRCVRNDANGSSVSVRPLCEEGNDIFIREPMLVSVWNKVKAFNETSLSTIVSAAKAYGLRAETMRNAAKFGLPEFSNEEIVDGYRILGLGDNQRRTWKYLPKDYPIPRVDDGLLKYKVFIAEAYGCGEIGEVPSTPVLSTPVLSTPGELCTETFLQLGPFETEEEAKNLLSYVKTKFFRALVGIKKQTQHTTQKVYQFVPMQDFSKPWTDAELYAKYNLTQEEIDFIESMIKPME